MLELESKSLEIKFKGEVYRLDFPKVNAVRTLQKNIKEKGEDIDHIICFLEDLGLKREISEDMEVSNLLKIVDALTEEKKS